MVADEQGGDPRALIEALSRKEVLGFGPRKVSDLEAWLTKVGAISQEEALSEDERLHVVLERVGSSMEPERVVEIVRWLEAARDKGAEREAPLPAQRWLTNLNLG